jgi:heavy metal translocating P-type ATPase
MRRRAAVLDERGSTTNDRAFNRQWDTCVTITSDPANSLDEAPSPSPRLERRAAMWNRRHSLIAIFSVAAIVLHLILRFVLHAREGVYELPLLATLTVGGMPLVFELLARLARRQFGSDLLAGISIVSSALMDEYLAGSLVVLMLSGGEALEAYAVRSASSVLNALAKRMPSVVHRRHGTELIDVALDEINVDDVLTIFPHEVCPTDGVVVEGHGVMDEAYLTGEPFQMSKIPGSEVISGSINGESALTIRAVRRPTDSRYAKIMRVMRESEQQRPRLRRLGDQLGALYTPLAVAIAVAAWLATGEARRFLAVLVVATPCPLLIAIPVAIIGAISLSAKRGIIVKDPAVLERIDRCRTMIFDKTGTLTYGEPRLTEQLPASGFDARQVLGLVASLERYSKHPLAKAILAAAADADISLQKAAQISETPGQGLRGVIAGRTVQITSRRKLLAAQPKLETTIPPIASGLECLVLIDGTYAGTLRFRDEPRSEGVSFVGHLRPKHQFNRLMLVSGDRESEVRYLAERVQIGDVYFGQSPEEKLSIVRAETAKAQTLYVGDGINDAPALTAATVGVAFGQNSDVTAEAAGAVIMDSSLSKVDEFLHISRRMRTIALQSAVGGIAASLVGMLLASAGYLPPVAGALLQEVIDVIAVLNALRAAMAPRSLTDF